MDLSMYVVERLAKVRLAEARAAAARHRLAASLRSPGPGLRDRLARDLIRTGHWLLGTAPGAHRGESSSASAA